MTDSTPDTGQAARKAMIDSQLRPNGVTDPRVLGQMARVPREDFVPAGAQAVAYIDRALPLGDSHFLAAPLYYGRLLSEAAPSDADRVLVVDGGSGYLGELCKPLAGHIDSISAQEAAAPSKKRKKYSLILIDGAIGYLPDSLGKRLEEGGRLVTGIVENGVTRLASGRKIKASLVLEPLAEMGIPVLESFKQPQGWQF